MELPGSGISEWRKDVTLNNKYLAGCLDALLRHLSVDGTGEFRTDGSPFYLVGFGNGGNIASVLWMPLCVEWPIFNVIEGNTTTEWFFLCWPSPCRCVTRLHERICVFPSESSRSSSVLLDSIPIFSILFDAGFGAIGSKFIHGRSQSDYVRRAHTVMSRGTCKHRPSYPLRNLHYPLIAVHSAQNGLVKPSHIAAIVDSRGGEVRSLQKALKYRKKFVLYG